MIVTVTLNPSLDRTLGVERLVPGSIVRSSAPLIEPGGKGVNVTRALTAHGIPSTAVLPIGGGEGAELARLLEADRVSARLVPVSGRTRSNITVVEPDGTVTKLNEPGVPLGKADLIALKSALRSAISRGDWAVFSGSVPPGLTERDWLDLLRTATDAGAAVAVDTSGDALKAAIGAAPLLVKPNRDELADLVGRPLTCIADVLHAAREIVRRGVSWVLATLGADGAVLVGREIELVGESKIDRARSTVGAGDSFLAGFLARFAPGSTDAEAALTQALAWGAAAASLPGSAVPGPADIRLDNVQLVATPDLDRPLVAT